MDPIETVEEGGAPEPEEQEEPARGEASWRRAWWGALAAVTLLRAALAARAPLDGAEAYHWVLSLHPEVGDDGLLPWAIRASTSLFGTHELALRLPSLAGVTLATVAIWWLARRTFGEEAGDLSGLAALSFPYLTVLAARAAPDGLLLGLCGLALALLWDGRRVAAGICLGLGVLAKLPAALVGLATLLWSRNPRFLWPWFAAATLTAAPWLAWNARNGLQQGGLQPGGPLEFLAAQAVAASPVLWAVTLGSAVWAARRGHEAGKYLAFHSLVPLALLSALANLQRQGPEGPLVGYLAARAAIGPACAESGRFRRGWVVAVALGGALTLLVLAAGLFPSILFSLAARPELIEPYAYKALAAEVESRRNGELVLSASPGLASALWFHSRRPVHSSSFRWERYDTMRGRDALVLDTSSLADRPDVRDLLASRFKEVGEEEVLPIEWRGRLAGRFYLVRCRSFRGVPPP